MKSNADYEIEISEAAIESMKKFADALKKIREENPWMFTEMYLQSVIPTPKKWKIKLFFAWFDMWVGVYYDRHFKILYVCLIPCCALKIWRE